MGLASSADKRELAESLGADATVDSQSDDLRGAILAANDGKKVDAVLHMSGGDAFDAEFDGAGAARADGRLRQCVEGAARRQHRRADAGDRRR